MNAEFNWWLLMVGLVVGAALVWFVVADQRRREVDIDAEERAREALWLSATLADEGQDVSPDTAQRLLALHRAYLEAPPPDEVHRSTDAEDAEDAPLNDRDWSELPGDDRRRVDRSAPKLGE
ncbi:MAG TPA: hypothetical protein VM408_01595 [Methylomirabilota bacterium]|nr:hypothetical protein [Methylomirabilota bacterium]